MYCIHCGHKVEDGATVCKRCGEDIIDRELTYDETRLLSQNLHNRLNKNREFFDSGMVGVVLGSTLLIIGILFFFLSFKVPDDPDQVGKVLKITCFEFWVSMAGLVSGGVLFVMGIIKVIIAKLVRQPEIMGTLNEVQLGTYKQVDNGEAVAE